MSQMTRLSLRQFALSLSLVPACVWIGDDEWERRLDRDGDGVSFEDDCAPQDASVYPGAEEICGNGGPEDCDPEGRWEACGWDEQATVELTVASASALSGEGWTGFSVAGAGDLNQDGLADMVIGAPETGGAVGVAHVVFGDRDMPSTLSADVTIVGSMGAAYEWGAAAGRSVDGVGDVDGDEHADLLIGSPIYNYPAGRAYLVLGPVVERTTILGDDELTFEGEGGLVGHAVSAVGDVNSDGRPDMLIGAPEADVLADNGGTAYLILDWEPVDGSDELEASATYQGSFASGVLGSAVAGAGDVNGDGVDDLLVGAYDMTADVVDCGHQGESGEGEVFLVFGWSQEDSVPEFLEKDLSFCGERPLEQAGYALSGAGDVNGDGRAELLVGAPSVNPTDSDDRGGFYLLTCATERCNGLSSVPFEGETDGGVLGLSVAAAGDVDGDDYADFLVGEPGNTLYYDESVSGPGTAYLYFGASDLAGVEVEVTFRGESEGDAVGYSVAGVGDVNGDTSPNLLIGAPGYGDPEVTIDPGVAFLLLTPQY